MVTNEATGELGRARILTPKERADIVSATDNIEDRRRLTSSLQSTSRPGGLDKLSRDFGAYSFDGLDTLPGELSGTDKLARYREAGLMDDSRRGGNTSGGFSVGRDSSQFNQQTSGVKQQQRFKTPSTSNSIGGILDFDHEEFQRRAQAASNVGFTEGLELQASEGAAGEIKNRYDKRYGDTFEQFMRDAGKRPGRGIHRFRDWGEDGWFTNTLSYEKSYDPELDKARSDLAVLLHNEADIGNIERPRKKLEGIIASREAALAEEEKKEFESSGVFGAFDEEQGRLNKREFEIENQRQKEDLQQKGGSATAQLGGVADIPTIFKDRQEDLSFGLDEREAFDLNSGIGKVQKGDDAEMSEFMSLYKQINERQVQRDTERRDARSLELQQEQEKIQSQRDAREKQLTSEADRLKIEAEEQREEAVEKAKSRLNASGRLTTDDKGNLDAEAVALLNKIESEWTETYNDRVDEIDAAKNSALSEYDQAMFKLELSRDAEMRQFDDQIAMAQDKRSASFQDTMLQAALKKSEPPKLLGDAKNGFFTYDAQSGQVTPVQGFGKEESGDAVSAILKFPASYGLNSRLIDGEAEKKALEEVVKEVAASSPKGMTVPDLRDAIKKKLLGFDFNTPEQEAVGDGLRKVMLRAPDDVQTNTWYSSVATLIREGDIEEAVFTVEREMMKSIDPKLEKLSFYNGSILKSNEILDVLKMVPDEALGKFEGSTFKLRRDLIEGGSLTQDQINATTRLQALLTGLNSDWRLARSGTAVTETELQQLEPILSGTDVDRDTLYTKLVAFLDNAAFDYNADRRAVGLSMLKQKAFSDGKGGVSIGVESPLESYAKSLAEEKTPSATSSELDDLIGQASPEQVRQIQAAKSLPKKSLMEDLIRVESAGNPRAISRAGAVGIAQLMPGTARELGLTVPDELVKLHNKLDKAKGIVPRQSIMKQLEDKTRELSEKGVRDDRFDESVNRRAAEQYLQSLEFRFKDQKMALAAYNWGPFNVSSTGARTWEDLKGKLPKSVLNYVNSIVK